MTTNKQTLHTSELHSTVHHRTVQRTLAFTRALAILALALPRALIAQCDWTFYADSLTAFTYGSVMAKFDASKERYSADGTKYIYGDNGELYMRITEDGRVFYITDLLPTFRLCDTLGTLYRSRFSPTSTKGDSGARYMHYLGLQPYHTLGQTRLCKVFLEYVVTYKDTITVEDTTQPVDIYAWDIDSDGTPELVMPVTYHILADSLGKVDEIDYHHQWMHNEVIGIWFGSRFVGDPLVGVTGYNENATSLAVRCVENGVLLSGIPEAGVGTIATLELYDLYGRLRTTQRITLVNNLAVSMPAGAVVSGDLCAWVLRQSSGNVTRGLVVVE